MRWILHCLLISLSFVIVAPAAYAHAKLVQSIPAADSTAATPPQEIRLSFNEPVAANLSRIELTTDEGSEVNVGPASAEPGGMGLVVPIDAPLPPGTYRVHWRTVSADMHKLEGDFAFEVRP